jgi:enoyl-CoA hydratase
MIHREDRDGVAVLRMEHGKANAMDVELLEGLEEAVQGLEAAALGPAAVVLTGTGAIFSAGVDLFRVLDGRAAYLDAFLPALSRALKRLFVFTRPVVAAVNGHAIAGGCVLACTADFRIMARGRGRIGVPELRVGVPFPTAAFEAVRFACAAQHVQRIVLDGDTFDADQALQLGLIDEVCEPDDLLDAAMTVARRLATRPPDAFAMTKRQVRGPTVERIAAASEVDRAVRDLWLHPDTRKRVADWVEKTMK